MPILTPSILFSAKHTLKADTAIIVIHDDKKLMSVAKQIDKKLGGLISHQLDSHAKFKGECGQILTIALPPKADYLRLIVLGLGKKEKATTTTLETAGGKLAGELAAQGAVKTILTNADDVEPDTINTILYGLRLGSYTFDEYKTVKKDKKETKLESLTIITADPKSHSKLSHDSENLAQSVALARDLVNAPPNKLYPESFAAKIKSTLTPLGVKVQIFDDKALTKMGMGCILAVGQASEHLPRLVIMTWPGAAGEAKKKKQKPLAFVGKGITFDSGGLNVKPYEGMMDMKMDMGGAATVTGLMAMLAKRKCKVPVVAAVALAENAISDEATRPSDIITSYSGKTVEVLNTDAEGRLVLADALTYIQKTFDPKLVVDLATLTGAIMIALGLNYCGAFVNDNALWDDLEKSSAATGEKLWRMPLDESFRREMDSVFADIKNVGNGRNGGSCTAAGFLSEFIDTGRPWAHLDIAGVAMSKATPTCPVPFASGYGVKLLNKFVEDFHG